MPQKIIFMCPIFEKLLYFFCTEGYGINVVGHFVDLGKGYPLIPRSKPYDLPGLHSEAPKFAIFDGP